MLSSSLDRKSRLDRTARHSCPPDQHADVVAFSAMHLRRHSVRTPRLPTRGHTRNCHRGSSNFLAQATWFGNRPHGPTTAPPISGRAHSRHVFGGKMLSSPLRAAPASLVYDCSPYAPRRRHRRTARHTRRCRPNCIASPLFTPSLRISPLVPVVGACSAGPSGGAPLSRRPGCPETVLLGRCVLPCSLRLAGPAVCISHTATNTFANTCPRHLSPSRAILVRT